MKICKYLKFEDVVKTLKNDSVILSNPADYNDPFDVLSSQANPGRELALKSMNLEKKLPLESSESNETAVRFYK